MKSQLNRIEFVTIPDQNPEKNSTKDESVPPKNNEDRTRGSHMAEVSSGLVWHKDYWVDKDTFDSMRSGEIPSKCPKCPKVFKRLFGLVRHWRGDKCPSIAGPGRTFSLWHSGPKRLYSGKSS